MAVHVDASMRGVATGHNCGTGGAAHGLNIVILELDPAAGECIYVRRFDNVRVVAVLTRVVRDIVEPVVICQGRDRVGMSECG